MNSRLSDPEQAASDGNIQAVLFMLAFENRFGTQTEAKIHLGGLRRMLTQRGGILALRSNSFLGALIWWAEMTGTAFLTLDCERDCDPAVAFGTAADHERILSAASLSLNEPLMQVNNQSDLHSACESFLRACRAFQSSDHVWTLRRSFGSGMPLQRLCAQYFPDPRSTDWPQGEEAISVLTQTRLACLLYINAYIYTSATAADAEQYFDRILHSYQRGYPTGGSIFGILWALAYSSNVAGLRNPDATRIVLDMTILIRDFSTRARKMVEMFLMQSVLGSHGRIGSGSEAVLDEDHIRREILCEQDR